MSFINEVRGITEKVTSPKLKALEILKEQIKSAASYGYNRTTISPTDFLCAIRQANGYQEVKAIDYIKYVDSLIAALKSEGFTVTPGEHSDGSGFFHIVKW